MAAVSPYLCAFAANEPPIPPPMPATRAMMISDNPRITRLRRAPSIMDSGRVGFFRGSFSPSLADVENSNMLSSLPATGEWCAGGGIWSLGWRRSIYDIDLDGPDTTSGASIVWRASAGAGGDGARQPPALGWWFDISGLPGWWLRAHHQ